MHPSDVAMVLRYVEEPCDDEGAAAEFAPAAPGWRLGRGGLVRRVDLPSRARGGHRARKATWLYAVTPNPPSLRWGRALGSFASWSHEYRPGRRPSRTGICQLLSHRERAATPLPFRDLLLSIARSAKQSRESAA